MGVEMGGNGCAVGTIGTTATAAGTSKAEAASVGAGE